MKRAVIGIVDSQAHAERIVSTLHQGGFGVNDISVLLPDRKGNKDFGHEKHTKAPEGAVAGVGTGGLLGGALGLLVGIGSLAIPGLGPFIAAGPIIAAISGYTELAKMELEAATGVHEHLDAVLTGSARAASLVRQILAFSRQQEHERRPVQLRDVVVEALGLLRATIPTTIEFESNFSRDLPTVLADPTQIHQILMNLSTNASHAMRGEGTIGVTPSPNFQPSANRFHSRYMGICNRSFSMPSSFLPYLGSAIIQ